MAFVIAQPCVGVKDTACVIVCPVDCIHPAREGKDFADHNQLYINADECIHCGLCVDECPVSAIFPIEEVPPEWEGYIEKNAAYFRRSR